MVTKTKRTRRPAKPTRKKKAAKSPESVQLSLQETAAGFNVREQKPGDDQSRALRFFYGEGKEKRAKQFLKEKRAALRNPL